MFVATRTTRTSGQPGSDQPQFRDTCSCRVFEIGLDDAELFERRRKNLWPTRRFHADVDSFRDFFGYLSKVDCITSWEQPISVAEPKSLYTTVPFSWESGWP